ncbi:MAG: hypothetical protein IH984_01230 [Planctomycetes bacterium]|nr:hypothetical protein [Planctomycetota bacterium]
MNTHLLSLVKRVWLVGILLIVLSPTIVFAQESQEDEDKKKDTPASLDDLLGLDSDEDEAKADDAARKQNELQLQQRLDEKEITDAFLVAISRMVSSAERLDELFDPGLATQRIQEDILAKLDQLIDKAQSMQSQSSSSSSSSSSKQQSSMKSGQQSSNSKSDGERQDGNAQDSQEGGPPARQEGDINTLLQEGAIEWGNLPQRLREELQQGRGDEYSSMYRKLTDEYYKRLAEEGSR